MPDVFDGDGNLIADFPLSQKQLATLEATGEITVIYHTPQLLRGTLGKQSGLFVLRKLNERIVTDQVPAVMAAVRLQRAIRGARDGA